MTSFEAAALLGKVVLSEQRLDRVARGDGSLVVYESTSVVDGGPYTVVMARHVRVETSTTALEAAVRDSGRRALGIGSLVPLLNARVVLLENGSFLGAVRRGPPGASLVETTEGRPWPVGEVVRLLGPIAEAMGRLHDIGFCYGALTPATVFVRDGSAVLDFFGLSAVAEVANGAHGVSELLSPNFRAPELSPESPVLPGPSADVYAFAALVSVLLAGAETSGRVRGERNATAVAAGAEPWVPSPRSLGGEVSDRVEQMLARSLSARYADRPADLRALVRELAAAASDTMIVPTALASAARASGAIGPRAPGASGAAGPQAPGGWGPPPTQTPGAWGPPPAQTPGGWGPPPTQTSGTGGLPPTQTPGAGGPSSTQMLAAPVPPPTHTPGAWGLPPNRVAGEGLPNARPEEALGPSRTTPAWGSPRASDASDATAPAAAFDTSASTGSHPRADAAGAYDATASGALNATAPADAFTTSAPADARNARSPAGANDATAPAGIYDAAAPAGAYEPRAPAIASGPRDGQQAASGPTVAHPSGPTAPPDVVRADRSGRMVTVLLGVGMGLLGVVMCGAFGYAVWKSSTEAAAPATTATAPPATAFPPATPLSPGATPAPAPSASAGPHLLPLPPGSLPASPASASEASALLPIYDGDAVRGDHAAPVTLVVFGDLTCPFTAGELATIPRLEQRYGTSLRVVFKLFPLPDRPSANDAAKASGAAWLAGPTVFWSFVEAAARVTEPLDAARIESLAVASGLAKGAASSAMSQPALPAAIERDVELGRRLNVRSTPTVFVNGRRFDGMQPYEKLTKYIDFEQRRAKELLTSGTRPDGIYAARVLANVTTDEGEKEPD